MKYGHEIYLCACLVVCLAGCSSSTSGVDGSTDAGDQPTDGGQLDAGGVDAGDAIDAGDQYLPADEIVCDPACMSPNTECVEGSCECLTGFHDGGDGACVAVGDCSAGFGIPDGDSQCLPLSEVCVPSELCSQAIAWSSAGCEFGPLPDGSTCQGDDPDPCVTGYECRAGECEPLLPECSSIRPIVFVHGVNGEPANFDVMAERLIDDGWPEDYLFFFAAEDPAWGCNLDNAHDLLLLVESALTQTCQPRIDLVAHSMGTLSSRYYVKNLGGMEKVNTYLTLGGQHHGLVSPCWAPDFLNVCIWQELCQWGDYIDQLNEDPATPGELYWVSMYGTADDVVPNDSSHLEGAENIEFEGVEHAGANGLLEVEAVYLEVMRVLQYACW